MLDQLETSIIDGYANNSYNMGNPGLGRDMINNSILEANM
jgi:hypothetical protein